MDEKDTKANADKKDSAADLSAMLGMGGFLDGVSSIISKFGELAERGESLRKASGETESGKPYQSSMGFSVKFGPGNSVLRSTDDVPHVTPINASARPGAQSGARGRSNAAKPAARSAAQSDKAEVGKIREPQIDLFEEEDHLLLLAEMPGVASDAVQLEFQGTQLRIEGTSKSAHFKTTLELPRAYTQDQVTVSANNGVIEIRLSHSTSDA